MNTRILASAVALMSLLGVAGAHAAPVEKSFCVYDPSGANGQVFQLMKDYAVEALAWGVKFELKAYTDEKTAADDFKAGKCDAALLTGTRLRPFQKFAGTLEAMGALPDYDVAKMAIKTLSKKGAATLLKGQGYEIAAIFPGGAIYLFVNDRAINTVEKLAGKKIATLIHDDASKTMVEKVGASMVAADVGTFAGKFNNGSADVCYAPAFAYQALELYKGLGDKGAVVRYPLAQLSLQILIRSKDFPEGFGQKSRAFAAKSFDKGLEVARKAEADIPAKHWMDLPDADKPGYDELLRSVRVQLRDSKLKLYHPKALKLFRKLRCKADAARGECVEDVE